jgi:transposase
VAGDQGYRSRAIRQHCRRRGIRTTIPRKSHERRTGPFDRALDRLRHRGENLFARCKQFRSLATRYDQRAASFRALWMIAFTMLWIDHVH